MSKRRRQELYAGATGRLTLAQAAQLGRGFVVQPKFDGSLCTALTDHRGRVYQLLTRQGHPFPGAIAADFAGVTWMPNSAVIGELEAWTEAGNRIAARRGYRLLHLFDALRVAGEDFSSRTYAERRDALLRAESVLVNEDIDKPWTPDAAGCAHDMRTGHYKRAVPLSWRRMPVTPQLPAQAAERAWADWVAPGEEAVEGLVVVATGARMGARSSKRKVKEATTIDAVVVQVGLRDLVVQWAGGTFAVGRGRHEVQVGAVVEIRHEGFYERGGKVAGKSYGAAPTPRFARLVVVRTRPDLQGARA